MSLVNKMLQNLEARQNDTRSGRPIFQDLNASHQDRRRGFSGKLVILVVALLVGGGYFAWQLMVGNQVQPVRSTAVSVPPIAAPETVPVDPVPVAPVASSPAIPPVPGEKPRVQPTSKPAANIQDSAEAMPKRPVKNETGQKSTTAPRIEKIERPYTPEELATNAYREAQQDRSRGNLAGAEQRLVALLATQPKNIQCRELLAVTQIQSGRWPAAQETLEQGIQQVVSHAAFRYQLAQLHLEHGNEAKAVAVLERARTDGIQDAGLPAFLAALYQRSGRHDDAIKNYKEALAAKPAEGKWWLGLGISLEAKLDAAAARDAYRRALDTNQLPDSLVRYANDRLKILAVR